MGWNFEFQLQNSFLEYFFLETGRFEKRIALSEKKPPLVQNIFSIFRKISKQISFTKVFKKLRSYALIC